MQLCAAEPQRSAATQQCFVLCTALQKILLAAPAASYRCSLAAKSATIDCGRLENLVVIPSSSSSARTPFSSEIVHMTKPVETFGEIGRNFAAAWRENERPLQPLRQQFRHRRQPPYRSIDRRRSSANSPLLSQQFGAAPADSAIKKLGRADWCPGSKRAI